MCKRRKRKEIISLEDFRKYQSKKTKVKINYPNQFGYIIARNKDKKMKQCLMGRKRSISKLTIELIDLYKDRFKF